MYAEKMVCYYCIQSTSLFYSVCVCVCMLRCLTLYNPMDCSPPGSSVHEIFKARILYWVDCHSLLWGIFLTQGRWSVDSLSLYHLGSPIIYSRRVISLGELELMCYFFFKLFYCQSKIVIFSFTSSSLSSHGRPPSLF